MQTSFKRKERGGKGSSSSVISGTRPSLHNGQLLCSTGVPSLDAVIGGGIPVGTVFVVEEDINHQYSDVLTRYFLAEGVMSKHGLFIASANENPIDVLDRLPEPILFEEEKSAGTRDNMKIAWRYENSPQIQTTIAQHSKYGHYYDISKNMNKQLIENSSVCCCDLRKEASERSTAMVFDTFRFVLSKLNTFIQKNNYSVETAAKSGKKLNVLRVVLPSFGSPFWGTVGKGQNCIQYIFRFLICLRTIARNSLVVCWLTLPTHLYSKVTLQRTRHLTDSTIGLESFGNTKTNPLFKEYHGLLTIHQLPALNSLLPFSSDSQDLAFKLRRKKFTIERLHLPPDIGEDVKRQGVEDDATNVFACSSALKKSSLDF